MKTKKAPMGWNSWDCYGASVNEDTVRANALYMAENLKKYGWEYVVVDIQWSDPLVTTHEYIPFTDLCMDDYGRLIPSPERFPSSADGKGFAPLAEYVHSLGLKFGIHIMRGIPRQAVHKNTPVLGSNKKARDIAKTDSICHWNTDMYGVNPEKEGAEEYYNSLFSLYASWGVDFIKCDDICRELPHEEGELIMLSKALHSCGRDMILSLSPGPAILEKAELYKQTADMWRITDDFWDRYELLYAMFERAEKWCTHTGAGSWPDADMLPVGPILQDYDKNNWTGFTKDEQYTMLTLWSIFRSPLMIGGEMTGFDDFTLDLLTNEGILKMHSDSRHAHQVWRKKTGDQEHVLWTSVSASGGSYLAIFNLSDTTSEIKLNPEDAEIYDAADAVELWSGETVNCLSPISIKLNPHGTAAFLINQS